MHYQQQHVILEKIFDFVKSQGRKDLIDAYYAAAKSKTIGKICKAGKNWKCCECKTPILKGTKYFREERQERCSNGTLSITKQICLTCHEQEKPEAQLKQNKLKFIKELL
jgi:ABC-type sugar transport system ATPase subunit